MAYDRIQAYVSNPRRFQKVDITLEKRAIALILEWMETAQSSQDLTEEEKDIIHDIDWELSGKER